MNRFSKTILGSILYLGMTTGHALPVGNIADPALYSKGIVSDYLGCSACSSDCWQFLNFRTGYYGDFVFERHVEFASDVDHASLYTNAGLLVLNFCNRVDVFATLGGTNTDLNTRAATPLVIPGAISFLPRLAIDTGSDFSWSLGGKAVLWQLECTYLGIEGQYFRTNQHISRATIGELITENPSNSATITYSEWQVGLGLAHRIAFAVPYIAVKWAGSKGVVNTPILLGGPTSDVQSKKRWGFATGATLLACDSVSFCVEGRFGDEKAVHVNGQIRF